VRGAFAQSSGLLESTMFGAAAAIFGEAVVFVLHAFCAYGAVCLSEWMDHRFVSHAHWAGACGDSLLWGAIHRHYLHHYRAHHRHCLEPATREKLKNSCLADQSDLLVASVKKEVEEQCAEKYRYVLEKTSHGFTVKGFTPRAHKTLMMLLQTTGTCMIVSLGGMAGSASWCAALLLALSPMCPLYMQINHDKFHSSRDARQEWADKAKHASVLERAFWTSEEIDRVAVEHELHHHGKRGRFFGTLPYYRFFVYPIWQTW
jgi:hypothetical protein